jgi:hypothetical protein
LIQFDLFITYKMYSIFAPQKLISAALLTFSFLILSICLKAQTTTTAGSWAVNSNWSTGTAPSSTSLGTNVIINKAMTFNTGSLTGYGATTITITSGGSLTVTGDFACTGSGIIINIQSGGSLSVSGITTLANGAKINIIGGGTPGSANLKALTVSYSGTMTINSGASLVATALTTTSNSDAIFNNLGMATINGNVSSSGIITNSGTMQVNGNFAQNNSGNSTTNSGLLTITGNASANGLIQLNPGASANSVFTVNGSMTITANPWLIVGTNVSACGSAITRYADAIIKTNVVLSGSGDITVNQNGRLIIFGNVDGTTSSGTLLTLSCGGQAYVNGNVNLGTGGGNIVSNGNNGTSPTGTNGSPVIGLYVNGTTTAQTTSGTVGTKNDMQANDNIFYNYIAGISGSPLPIKLLYFNVADVLVTGVALEWATATEINFDKFILERAGENLSFESIGEIDAKGGVDRKANYQYTDQKPLTGKNYYRLKSIDLDKKYEYSNVVFANWEAIESAISVYPNPITNNTFTIELNDELSSYVSVQMINSIGHKIFQQPISTNKETFSIEQKLDPGVYFVIVKGRNFNKTIKVLVQ